MPVIPTNYPNPQGLLGDCSITFKSDRGWFPQDHRAQGYPTECFKTFNLPQDLKHFENRPIASVADEFVAAQSVVNALAVRLVKMAKNQSSENTELKRNNEQLKEKDTTRDKVIKEQSEVLKRLNESDKIQRDQLKKAEEELDIMRESAKITEKENKTADAREKELLEKVKAAEDQARAAETQASNAEGELIALKVNPSTEMRALFDS